MRTTKKDFVKFQKECTIWLDRFWLREWQVFYSWQDLDDGTAARTEYAHHSKNVEFSLNRRQDPKGGHRQFEQSIEDLAKHEVIHLLLADLIGLAESRYCTKEEIESAEHALVQKLMKLLKLI